LKIQVLDRGFVELQDMMGDDLAIVNAARVSYLGESKGAEQDKKLLFYLMEHKHSSPFEQVEFKFLVKLPIFVARQWMRHRTWSYNEQSRRYTDDTPQCYFPTAWRKQSTNNKQGSDGEVNEVGFLDGRYLKAVDLALDTYEKMLEMGVAKEQARIVLPHSLYTTFVAKVDAHNLMHFLTLRLDPHAQWEIRQYAEALYEIMKEKLPWTTEAFDKYRRGQ